MGETRARTIPAEGPAAVLDPSDPGPFLAKAGPGAEVHGDTVTVVTRGGDRLTARAGRVVIETGRGPVFAAPEQAEVLPG